MRCVVVTNNVNLFILGRRLVDLAEKYQPFLMSMPLGTGTQHFTRQGVQRGKQRRSGVAFVIMRHGRCLAFFNWQARGR